jgi:hypothetical protein
MEEREQTKNTTAAAVRIRDLTGYDEQLIQQADTETAIVLVGRWCGFNHRDAIRLTPGERDRLLAGIYQKTYSARVEGTVQCTSCKTPFDVHFMLDELVQSVRPSGDESSVECLPDRTFRTADGVRFRLPTGEDELAVRGLTPAAAEREMMRRCVIEAGANLDANAVQVEMERMSPIFDLILDAHCPECATVQTVQFDLQLYLLQALAQERKQLWRDTHALAAAYHWSPNEILGLPRSDRRFLVSILEGEAARRTAI